MKELSKKEKNLLNSLHVSAKAKEEIRKVWLVGEYKYQREYTNALLLLIPMFIITFIAVTGAPELAAIKYFAGWTAWGLYFAIPTVIILRICFKTLASHDRTVLLGHSAMYLWRRPKPIKRIYSTVVSLLLILILVKVGLVITSFCLALTFVVISFCTIAIRRKVQIVLDEIDQRNDATESLPIPEGIVP